MVVETYTEAYTSRTAWVIPGHQMRLPPISTDWKRTTPAAEVVATDLGRRHDAMVRALLCTFGYAIIPLQRSSEAHNDRSLRHTFGWAIDMGDYPEPLDQPLPG